MIRPRETPTGRPHAAGLSLFRSNFRFSSDPPPFFAFFRLLGLSLSLSWPLLGLLAFNFAIFIDFCLFLGYFYRFWDDFW